MKALFLLINIARTNKIVAMLKEYHNFDISDDVDTIGTIMSMIRLRDLSNKEIVKEIMEIHTISMKEMSAE